MDFKERMHTVIRSLVEQLKGTILVAGHAATVDLATRSLLGINQHGLEKSSSHYPFCAMLEMQSPHFKLLRLCRDAINGSLKPDLVAVQLKELTQQNPDIPSLLLDVLQIVDAEAELDATGNGRKRLETLVTLVSGSLIPDDVLKLELDAVGASETSTKSRLVKTKTRLFYKQLKFNLLREESEGYAKLLTELTDFNDNLGATVALGRVRCLIGQFNLDPNRVLDIVLECFECSPERSTFFSALLKEFRASKDDICHILGFKFTFYHSKTNSRTPDSLYKVAGLLCHENLLDLQSLCSYLTPKLDELMNDHKMRIDEAGKRAKKAEVVSSAAVAEPSTTNGDVPPPSGTAFAVVTSNQDSDAADDDADTLAENQKLGLTCALLEIGDWSLAKQMLDRLPEYYAVNSSRRIATAVIDMIGAAIEFLYREKCQDQQVCADLPRRSGSKRRQNVAQELKAFASATSWKDLADDLLPVLGYLGPNLAYRPVVMTKLIRLVSAFFLEKTVFEKNGLKDGNDGCIVDPDLVEFNRISPLLIDLCDEVLVPSLTMADGNSALSDELWLLLSQFPYTLRYRFYGRWKSIHTLRHPGLLLRRGRVVGKTRYVVKRLSKETTKIIGRQIGKLSHTHPAVVFDYLLNQIQTFENLIGPVVESVRFLTFLEFDVLSYCIIEHLASPDKQQLKASDGTLSPWLQSLATFVGAAFKKYNMELTGVLQYVANQLKNGKSFDLLVLREVIQNMSGIETTSALTIEQLEALAGGDVLRQEGGSFGQVKNVRRATNRLREALFQEDLVVGLCILTAQQRGCIVFEESESFPLKLTGQMLDQCQDTLVQFGNFLSTTLRPDDYSKRMPSAPELISQYHLPPDAAMFLARPIFVSAVNAKYDKTKNADKDRDDKGRLSVERKNIMYHAAFSSLARELSEKLKAVVPESMWTDLSPSLFVTFWSLTMYDLNVPVGSYDREIEKVKKAIQLVQDNAEGLSKTKRTKEEERLKNLETRLTEEKRRQMEHVDRIKYMFRTDREGYFVSAGARVNQITQFLQNCILPRAIFTDMDAIYCAKFIELLHSQRTHFFPTAVFLDKLFFDIGSLIAGLSENEANFFGRFLSALLEHVMRWHSDKAIYDKECFGFPGFFSKMRRPNTTVDATLPDDAVPYDGYRSLCFKWHRCLTRSFIAILGSSSYVLVRNGLQVLLKLLSSYPIISGHVLAIEKRVVIVRDQEKGKRDDLSLMAASYAGHLKMRKSKVLEEADFHTMQKPPAKKTPAKPAATVSPLKMAAPAVKATTTKAAGEATKSAAAPVVKTEPPSPTVSSAASNDKRKRPATDATDSSSSVEKRRKDDGSSSVAAPKKAPPPLKATPKEVREDGEITEPTTPVAKASAAAAARKVVKTVKAENSPSSPTAAVDREKDREKAKDKPTIERSNSNLASSSNDSKKDRPKDSSAKNSPKTTSGHRAIVAPSPDKRSSSKETEKREKEKMKPSTKEPTPASDRSDGSGGKRSKRSAENGSSSSAAPVKKSKSTSKEKEREKPSASSVSKSKEASVSDKRNESDGKTSSRERERSSDSRKVRK